MASIDASPDDFVWEMVIFPEVDIKLGPGSCVGSSRPAAVKPHANAIEDLFVGCVFPEGEQGANVARLADLPLSAGGANRQPLLRLLGAGDVLSQATTLFLAIKSGKESSMALDATAF